MDGEYRGTNHLIAGLYGSTPSEHVLYKTYRHLLLDTFKNKTSVVSYLIKELTDDDVKEKIDNLRSRRNPWSEQDLQKITEFSKKNNTYGSLLRTHSDLDILEKVTEVGKADLISFSKGRTNFFENSFRAFMKNYKKALEKRRLQEEERLKQQQAEEENRKRNEERKKQMKNFKPTIVVVSKKK